MSTKCWNRKVLLALMQTEFRSSTQMNGSLFLIFAYSIWGLSPIFWKTVSHVSPFELLMHRTIWSFVLFLAMILIQRSGRELYQVFISPKHIIILTITTLVLALNWYLFIWAVNTGNVLQTSLAYYINPLLIVFLGMTILKEKLQRFQIAALIIAAAGVTYYTISLGEFPWISIALAITFAIYSLIHKILRVPPLPGLCIETFLLSIPASGFLFYFHCQGKGAAFNISMTTDFLLFGTSLLTGLPLLLFIIGVKRSTLTMVGFMQYIAPCCSFLLAVFYYKEPFSKNTLITFAMIWTALAIYSIDSLYQNRKPFR